MPEWLSLSIVNMEVRTVEQWMDVQRRRFCALVVSHCDVRRYVDIRVLQGLLQSNIQNKWQFEFVDYSWHHASRIVYKWNICLSHSFVKLLYIIALFVSYRQKFLRINHVVCLFQSAVSINLDMINRWQICYLF